MQSAIPVLPFAQKSLQTAPFAVSANPPHAKRRQPLEPSWFHLTGLANMWFYYALSLAGIEKGKAMLISGQERTAFDPDIFMLFLSGVQMEIQ